MNRCQPKGTINPSEQQWIGVPIWCVYGHPSWPHFICCQTRIVGIQQQVNIYGYTERKPGHGQFNAIDQPVASWAASQNMCVFFGKQSDALAFLGQHMTPRGVK